MTTNEKIAAYEHAKALIKSETYGYICPAIMNYVNGCEKSYEDFGEVTFEIEENFPELWNARPSPELECGSAWFGTRRLGRAKRLELLDSIILKLKQDESN